jgi:hypothetical protein
MILAVSATPDLLCIKWADACDDRHKCDVLSVYKAIAAAAGSTSLTEGEQKTVFANLVMIDDKERHLEKSLGAGFRVVAAGLPNFKLIVRRILEGLSFEPTLKLVQSTYALARLTRDDMSETNWIVPRNVDYGTSDAFQEIRDRLWCGNLAVHRVYGTGSNKFVRDVARSCTNEIVNDLFAKPIVDERFFEPRLEAACARRGLTVTRSFKAQVESLEYSLRYGKLLAFSPA